MKIYVLTRGNYDDFRIEGVTDSEDKAKQWIDAIDKRSRFSYPSYETYDTDDDMPKITDSWGLE